MTDALAVLDQRARRVREGHLIKDLAADAAWEVGGRVVHSLEDEEGTPVTVY